MGTADRAAADRALVAAGAMEPVDRVPGRWTARFALLWLGFWMAWLVPVQLVLPNQFGAVARRIRCGTSV